MARGDAIRLVTGMKGRSRNRPRRIPNDHVATCLFGK